MKHLILSILLFSLPLFASVTGTDQNKEPTVNPKLTSRGLHYMTASIFSSTGCYQAGLLIPMAPFIKI
jgi:hypothetical protein